MPLFKVNLPANVGIFFGYIMMIASFDLVPVDSFVDEYGGMTPTEPINENFEAVGFESLYVLINLGTILILVIVFPILIIAERIMRRLKFAWA